MSHGKLPAPFRRKCLAPNNSLEKRFDSQSRFMHPGFCKHRQGRICGNGILSKQRSMASPHRTNLLLAAVINIINIMYIMGYDVVLYASMDYISIIFYHNLSDSICKAIINIEKGRFEAISVHTSRKEWNGINECQKKTTFPSFPLLKNQNFTKHLVHVQIISNHFPCKSPHISTKILIFFRRFFFW